MNIFFTFPICQSIRDHIHLGTIRALRELMPELNIIALSPAYNVPEFIALCEKYKLIPRRSENTTSARENERLVRLRRKMGKRWVNRLSLKIESWRYNLPNYTKEVFEAFSPALVVLNHPMTSHDYAVFIAAKKYGVPTLGIVNSWDNLRKRLTQWTDRISVWNEINYREAVAMNAYKEEEVTINGPVSFDPFFDENWWDDRQTTGQKLDLNPDKKWITYATSGVYNLEYYGRDETWLVHELIQWMNKNPSFRDTQLLIRLHPLSRLIDFLHLQERYPDIRFSHGGYMPGIGWYTSEEDYRLQVNILKHSDVIVTPGSSWTIEAAIFDTPVVVPVYSTLQPEHAAAQFDRFTLARHFKPILENGWVPITRSPEETEREMAAFLESPGKGRDRRKQLVDNYVHFRDGKSAQRVARWIANSIKSLNSH